MYEQQTINTFKHEIGLRLLKLVNLLLMVVPFAVSWFLYYDGLTAVRYYWKGDVAIIVFFALLYFYFGKTYDAFLISHFRTTDIVSSQALSLFLSDGLFYAVMFFLAKRLVNPMPLILVFADQVAISMVWTTIAQWIYFKWFPAKKSIIVYDVRKGMRELIDKYGLSKKFDVRKTMSAEECLADLSVIDEMDVVFLSGIHSHDRNVILKYCLYRNKQVYMIPRIGDVLMRSARTMHMFNLPILRVNRYSPNPLYLVIKRCFDIVFSLVALILLIPVFIVTAIAVKTSDKGPVFYKQLRLTKNGKRFYIHKFRSMRVDAEGDGVARLSSGDSDSRVTPVGRVIRKLRIDELPQLIDVLAGNLSLVGPRPERPEIAEEYMKSMPEFQLRLQCKAGLTGYAQVYGKYNTTPYDKLHMDLMYIANPSIIEDIRICFATIKILFTPDSTEGIAEGQTTAMDNRQKQQEG
ncbi:sugar transferase [Butyrivibrio sp. AE2032]|uniref:sugar transferase n=1 Tax=Butyrivibrio sp. AE2032 TaxID=1458463 RepID=UPI000558E9E8|nr:sugar transferase [Butyrivibrio sp. AE2032]